METNGKLIEEHIQNSTLAYLSERYYGRKNTYEGIEKYTIQGKRADGLICFPYKKESSYVVSLEAKSFNTLSNLKPYFDSPKATKHGRNISFVVVMVLSIFIYTKIPPQYLEPVSVLLILSFYIGTGLFIVARLKTSNFSWVKTIPVIEQLDQYPANEKWLAIGNDSVKDSYIYKNLLIQCQKLGIGVIVMDQNERFSIKSRPRYKNPKKDRDFLSQYADHKKILKQIGKQSSANTTKAHAQYLFRNVIRNVCFSGCLVLTLAYLVTNDFGTKRSIPEYSSNNLEYTNHASDYSVETSKCPFFGFNEALYLIVDDIVEDEQSAMLRCQQLRDIGFSQAHYFRTDCVSSSLPERGNFCIYPIPPSEILQEVENLHSSYLETLSNSNLEIKFGRSASIFKRVE